MLLGSCVNDDGMPENPLFVDLPSDSTGITFSNSISAEQEFNIFNYRNFYNGGGVAIGDINNDGLDDIYLTSNQGSNTLYLNEGDFSFKDITKNAGVAGSRPWSTGVTMADVNGDGLLDIYVLNSADIKGNNRENELFINQGDLTFKEEAEKYNLDDNGYSVHATFFDYDQDGDLDCYLVNNSFKGADENMKRLLRLDRNGISGSGGDKLLRNDDGVFTDVSQQAGIYQGEIGFGLGAIAGDINGDHLPDIYVSNDFWERDYLYINLGNGEFSEELVDRTSHISQSSMGSDMADINNDGSMDIFTTDMLPTDHSRIKTMTVFDDYHFEDMDYHGSYHYQYVQNTMQLNNRNGTFSEIGFLSGVAGTDWSWGALMFDFTNNGWNDIFVSNGIYRDVTDKDFRNFISDRSNIARIVKEKGEFNILDFLERMPSQKTKNAAFTNNKNKTFTNRSDSLGFYEPTFSNGAAYGDLDNDGDLDLIVNNIDDEASIFRNNTDRYQNNNFLKVKFEGEGQNPFGIGAHVKLYTDGNEQVAENMTSRSFQSSVPPQVYFGLGETNRIDSLVVIWPDHQMQVMKDVEVNQEITLQQSSSADEFVPVNSEGREPLIEEVTEEIISGNITHKENDYIDFNHNPLLPHMLSTRGPEMASGDVNGDGREDLFITGGLNDPAKLFIQQNGGRFEPRINPDLIQDNIFEGTATELFDIDGDGDLDLMVGNGGNQYELDSAHNELKVYENQGDGNFIRASHMVPEMLIDACCIKAHDFDDNGTNDVFIGGRVNSQRYGEDPRSYLLENDGNGNWTDITPSELKNPGMVTDAIWTDYDRDGDKDLIVVGEWMPITFFRNNNGTIEFDYSLQQSSGWWSSIKEVDLDEDGSMDYVLGNWGLNSKFKASPERPVTMYVNDFNDDEETEFLINTYQPGDDTAYPFPTYNDLTSEMPFLQKRITSHRQYAEMTYEDIFTNEEREGALKKEVQTMESAILTQRNGKYELESLPIEAQVSPIYAIVAEDFNDDGLLDLLLLGNMHGLKPEVGRLADNYGVFLMNKGEMNFEFVPYDQTDVFIKGEVRDAIRVDVEGENHIIISKNDDDLMIFR